MYLSFAGEEHINKTKRDVNFEVKKEGWRAYLSRLQGCAIQRDSWAAVSAAPADFGRFCPTEKLITLANAF